MLQCDNGSEDIGYAFLARRVSQAAHASSPNNGGRGLHLGGPWWKYSVKNRGCHDEGEPGVIWFGLPHFSSTCGLDLGEPGPSRCLDFGEPARHPFDV